MKYKITIMILMLVFACHAQDDMLIGQLSDRMIERENYDDEGVLLNKQLFEAGEIRNSNGFYELEVITKLFDEDEKLTDAYSTTYRCKPYESSIMVMAFPFADPKSKETEINSKSANFKELYDLENLQDIELELTFDSGLLNLFGSKSRVRIFERTLDIKNNKKVINSKIHIKTYALGIRVKQLEYNVIEVLTDENLLSFQKFVEKDKSYFTMNYEK